MFTQPFAAPHNPHTPAHSLPEPFMPCSLRNRAVRPSQTCLPRCAPAPLQPRAHLSTHAAPSRAAHLAQRAQHTATCAATSATASAATTTKQAGHCAAGAAAAAQAGGGGRSGAQTISNRLAQAPQSGTTVQARTYMYMYMYMYIYMYMYMYVYIHIYM
jgi:hypothetical protein